MTKPDNVAEGDFANYFCTYGYARSLTAASVRAAADAAPLRSYLFHQKEMLEDQQRMQAYYDAVFNNKSCFEGKVRLGGREGSPSRCVAVR
jgi:protein arginine N-methyltransferase 1